MKAYNIHWDIDIDEALDVLDKMTVTSASKFIEIPERQYENMTTSERHDYAYSYFRHCPGALDDLFGLPETIEIPESITDDDDISDWLSDEYGFCHKGFSLDTD